MQEDGRTYVRHYTAQQMSVKPNSNNHNKTNYLDFMARKPNVRKTVPLAHFAGRRGSNFPCISVSNPCGTHGQQSKIRRKIKRYRRHVFVRIFPGYRRAERGGGIQTRDITGRVGGLLGPKPSCQKSTTVSRDCTGCSLKTCRRASLWATQQVLQHDRKPKRNETLLVPASLKRGRT